MQNQNPVNPAGYNGQDEPMGNSAPAFEPPQWTAVGTQGVPPQGYAGVPPQNAPGTYPPNAYPPTAYPPGTYPPASYPPGTYPPGCPPQVGYPPIQPVPGQNVAPEDQPPRVQLTPPTGRRATPPTGLPPAKHKSPRGLYITLIVLVFGFAAYAVFTMLAPGKTAYGYVTAGTLSASYRGDALIVRNETVFTQEGVSQIDYVAEEGAEVNRADNVCTVYTSGFNTKELTTLETYRAQIKEYHRTLLASSTTKDMKLERLENSVLELALQTQALAQGAQGSLVNQEALLTSAMQDRQVYLKQKYPDDQKLTRLYDDENTQMQKISSWTKQYAATADGIVSFYTDGYENVLNLTNYADYSPTDVRNMINGNIPADETLTKNTVSIYRLVRQGEWVVLMLCDLKDWTPVEGNTYKLLIESFDNTIVDATVQSFTRSGGELLLRLTITGNINIGNVLYMRTCSVQIGESVDSLTVPSRAIYVQDGQNGVVMVTDGGNYFTPVTVLGTDGDIAHIIPTNSGVLYEGLPVLLF